MSRPSEILGEAEFGADRPVAAALRTRDVPGVNNQLEGRRLPIARQAFDRAVSRAAGLGPLLVLRGEHVSGEAGSAFGSIAAPSHSIRGRGALAGPKT